MLRTWFQKRLPISATEELLTTKTVPMHRHYLWYYLGGILLLSLMSQICTGFLLVVHYQASVPTDPEAPGAYDSVHAIVNDLPHGWWIRSLHHWGAHLMIMATFIHMFSVLILKAYRKPREFIWWSGLALMGLTLVAGFTGYLLPWNELSFAATRVGGGIAGTTPLAGPLIHNLLLAGPDVTEATLVRFFGLHVAILPMMIVALVGVHVGLIAFHGSSSPPSIQKEGRPVSSIRFWPEFLLRDGRVWLLVLFGLLVIVFLYPPPLGHRADPMAPAPEEIKPEWYFLPMFKALKLLPDHFLGLENMEQGILSFGLIGMVLAAMPFLYVTPRKSTRIHRADTIRRRCLLLATVGLGWAASVAPIQHAVHAYWQEGSSPNVDKIAVMVPYLLALAWVIVAFVIDHRAASRPNAPATFFGVVLALACIGYTFWEALGATWALVALAASGLGLVIICSVGMIESRASSRTAILFSGVLLLAMLFSVIPLAMPHGAPADGVGTDVATEVSQVVTTERRVETGSRLLAILASAVFLVVVIQRRISYQRQLRGMGLMKVLEDEAEDTGFEVPPSQNRPDRRGD